jgi:aspartate/methionine/tyrosine aminotransferase
MENILELANRNKIPVVADEVYYGQVFKGQETLSFGHVTKEVPVIAISG